MGGEGDGENITMSNFKIFTKHNILLGLSNQIGQEGCGVRRAWER